VEAVVGTNPSPAEWQPIFDLISKGPAAWPSGYPSVSNIGQGCGKPEANHSVVPKFPCELLKAIAMHESAWQQFCVPGLPADQKGKSSRTIISFDCGYGVGQVTSGMHTGENPAYDRKKVAGDPSYNLATSTQILASKWKATECVGDNQPKIVEDWYTAVWAYNGLAWSNNPNNPNLDANRGVWDPNVGGSYAYQERVFGRVEHPNSSSHWTSVALAYPDRTECGTTGKPPALKEPFCSSPTNCTKKRSVHVSSCLGNDADAGIDSGKVDASVDSSLPDSGKADVAIDSAKNDATMDSGNADSPNDLHDDTTFSDSPADTTNDVNHADVATEAAADALHDSSSSLDGPANNYIAGSSSGDDGGCSCSIQPTKERLFAVPILAGLLAIFASRRRNRRN